jgi:hypothetical protein
MDAMGPEWSARTKVAYILTGIVLAAFILARAYACESMGEIIMAFVFAIITGILFFQINKSVFGVESMNFLGLPYLVTKDSKGSPIYVCAAEKDGQ